MAASVSKRPWSFDIASLMVLVGEGEEEKYRLSQRSFLECLVTAPVVGLQNYARSYEFLLDAAKLDYFSPTGVKKAPLRYMRLSNAIKYGKLLEDSRYSVLRIPNSLDKQKARNKPGVRNYNILFALWVLFTWIVFAGVIVFTIKVPNATWIGVANCAAFTGWSVILRIIEKINIQLAEVRDDKITLPGEEDAVYILGRNNSAFVLEGTRRDVKYWTVRGQVYQKSTLGVPALVWQTLTRLGSLLMLLFIFSSIPNGSTMDQLAFVIINGLAQINVLVGQRLNSASCLAELETEATEMPLTRTDVYGLLVRRFKTLDAKNSWIDASGLLPLTEEWKKWKMQTLQDDGRDVNDMYENIARRGNSANLIPNASPAIP